MAVRMKPTHGFEARIGCEPLKSKLAELKELWEVRTEDGDDELQDWDEEEAQIQVAVDVAAAVEVVAVIDVALQEIIEPVDCRKSATLVVKCGDVPLEPAVEG